MMKAIALISFILSGLLSAKLNPQWESTFTEAQIAFASSEHKESLRLLNQILKREPSQKESLELQAEIYQSLGNWKEAGKSFQRLLASSDPEAKSSMGNYAFKAGEIALKLNKRQLAKNYFNQAILENTEVSASSFSVGKIEFDEKNWAKAREYLREASKSSLFRPSAQTLIALTYKNENRVSDALGAFIEAKEAALYQLRSGSLSLERSKLLAQDVLKTADRELRSFDRASWTAEVGASSGYDSNVLTMPNSDDAANISSEGSFKQDLFWRLRYASSPTNPWQYLGTYSGAINHNFNELTRGGQFFSHDITQYITRGYLKRTQFGAKLSGTGLFQYRTDAYRPFSLSGSVGPFVKTKIEGGWIWGAESYFSQIRNYLDDSLPFAARRSGWEQNLRTYLAYSGTNPYWAPGVYLAGTLLRPEGTEFSGSRINIDFTNAMTLSSSVFIAQSIGALAAWYPNRALGERTDQGLNLAVSGGYQATPAFSLIAQLSYDTNFSSDGNFRYNRYNGSLSGTYRF